MCDHSHDSQSPNGRKSSDCVDESQPKAKSGSFTGVGKVCRVVVDGNGVTKKAHKKICYAQVDRQRGHALVAVVRMKKDNHGQKVPDKTKCQDNEHGGAVVRVGPVSQVL